MSDLDIFFEEQMEDDKFKAEFDALSPKYELVRKIINVNITVRYTAKEFNISKSTLRNYITKNFQLLV